MPPIVTGQGAGTPWVKAVEMETGLPSSRQREIRQAHVRLLSAFRLAPSADRRLSPVATLEAGRVDPGRHRTVCVARGHAGHPSVRLGPRWADDENLVNTELPGVTYDAGAVLMVGLSGLLTPSRLLEVASSRLSPKCQTAANPSEVRNTCSPLLSPETLCLAPMHPDCLLILTFDGRDPHPDVGLSSLGIPTFDLVSQWLALGGKADVLAPRLRLAEIEILLV